MRFNKLKKLKCCQEQPKILYIMHIDWAWIFQRPQILELKLNEYFNIKTIFNHTLFGRKNLQKKQLKPSWYSCFIQLRGNYKYNLINWINKQIGKYCIFRDAPNSFDIIWLCYPTLISFIPHNYKGIIVYDCMDDHSTMTNNEGHKQEIIKMEKLLVERANIIFTSSGILNEKMKKLVANPEKVTLLRNGFGGRIWCNPNEIGNVKSIYKIGYIGTVASWFDFKLIDNSLSEYSNITYHIVGPYNDKYECNDRIKFEGTIEHDNLFNFVKEYDCLIMPFKIIDIVLAVDPVKLYEYISYGKCIITVRYPEIERFSDFVYFYSTQEEYNEILREKCIDGFKPKYTKEQQIKFLEHNTWDVRCSEVVRKLHSLNGGK